LVQQGLTIPQAVQLAMQRFQAGDLAQAESLLRKIISIQPNAELVVNLGVVLDAMGKPRDAAEAYRQAIRLRPDLPEAHNNLGNAHIACGELDEAIASYEQALKIRPDYPQALSHLGNTLKDVGYIRPALDCYERAIQLQPQNAEFDSARLYALHFDPAQDSTSILRQHQSWNQRHALPLAPLQRPHENDRNQSRRLRIGYVSPYFRTHCLALYMIPLFGQCDREQFEIYFYSDMRKPDGVTQRLRPMPHVWRPIAGLPDAAVAQMIRADQIDILVDLTMHMAGGRPKLMALKPAPVQVAWFAYPCTTGISAIDYRLTDPHLDPPGAHDDWYSEKSLRLPDSFWCYDAFGMESDPAAKLPDPLPPPAKRNGFITFGCLNNFCKINAPILDLWARVMQEVNGSRLRLLAPRGQARDRTWKRFAANGISPDRIEFVDFQPRKSYLAEFTKIDLCLDTLPYNGHTTSLDSFWMGVPVVTRVGETVVGRAGVSQLANLGLPELAGADDESFVKIAVELANDLPRLAELHGGLRDRMLASPLCDASKFARGIEATYRQMWNAYISGTR
jgi:predicted O-linked N-acetylglucosamine transferase (SPINDLY family)